MTAVVWLLRLAGRLLIAASWELDEAWRDRDLRVPDYAPDWIDDGSAS